ncbi:PKD domain-containing protein [Candidatus Lokiarchaeum ossiferum]
MRLINKVNLKIFSSLLIWVIFTNCTHLEGTLSYNTRVFPISSSIEEIVGTSDNSWSWGINVGDSLIYEFLEPQSECEYTYFKYVISEACIPNLCGDSPENSFYSVMADFYVWDYNGTVGHWLADDDFRSKTDDSTLIGNTKETGEIILNLPEFPLVFPCNTTITQMLGENLGALYDMQEFFSEEMMNINFTDYSFFTEIIDSTYDYLLNFTINPVLGAIDYLDIRLPDNISGMLDFEIHSIKSGTIPGNNLPVANVSVIQSKNEVEFYSISESEDPIINYLWQFGDGFNSTTASDIHLFNATGTYAGNLTIWDCNGDFSIQNFKIEVVSIQRLHSVPGYHSETILIVGLLAIFVYFTKMLRNIKIKFP